jgi:ComF family protein
MQKFWNFDYIVDFVFPRVNPLTGFGIHKYLSAKEINEQREGLKVLKAKQRSVLENVFVASKYNNQMAILFDKLKIGLEYKISQDLAELLYQKIWIDCKFFIPDPDILVTVPDDSTRLLQRGFSVNEKIFSKLAALLDKPIVDMLIKKRSTNKQSKLLQKDREKNLKNVFELINSDYNFSQVEILWLVDDITSTGTTLFECAKKIKKKYPFIKIYGVVVSGN